MPSHPAAKLMQGELHFLGQLDPAKDPARDKTPNAKNLNLSSAQHSVIGGDKIACHWKNL